MRITIGKQVHPLVFRRNDTSGTNGATLVGAILTGVTLHSTGAYETATGQDVDAADVKTIWVEGSAEKTPHGRSCALKIQNVNLNEGIPDQEPIFERFQPDATGSWPTIDLGVFIDEWKTPSQPSGQP